MPINKEKILEVAEFIRNNPQSFQMQWLIAYPDGSIFNHVAKEEEVKPYLTLENLKAGKIRACIAGITCLLNNVETSKIGSTTANELLVNNFGASCGLFFTYTWTEEAKLKWKTLTTDEEKANFAADYMLQYYGLK